MGPPTNPSKARKAVVPLFASLTMGPPGFTRALASGAPPSSAKVCVFKSPRVNRIQRARGDLNPRPSGFCRTVAVRARCSSRTELRAQTLVKFDQIALRLGERSRELICSLLSQVKYPSLPAHNAGKQNVMVLPVWKWLLQDDAFKK